MVTKTIRDDICENLSLDEQKIALDFIKYLEENGMIFFRDDHGYWRDKIYYWIKFNNECVCFIAIKNPDEPENHWTVWSDDMKSDELKHSSVSEEIREAAWNHIDFCGRCGSCGGGRSRVIFDKEFKNVCGCTFRVDNPQNKDLPFLKEMAEIRKRDIMNHFHL